MEPAPRAQDVGRQAVSISVVDQFERQVDTDPKRDAIRRSRYEADRNVSFEELDAWANAIASDLVDQRGATAEPVPLAICAPDLMLAAALGTLKAGKFYVPVNPTHPAPHVQRVLDELDAPLLLCDQGGEHVARRGLSAHSVQEIVASRSSDGRPGLRFDGDRLAYVLYTSGSTGNPRGVAQSRRDMLHNVARHSALGVGRDDCVTLISADGFLAAVSNPYVALLGGAALAPYSFKNAGADGMVGWLKSVGVTVLYSFPSFLRQVAAIETSRVHSGLRLAYLGGETVLPGDLASARRLFPAAVLGIGLNSTETGLTCLHLVSQGCALPDPVPVGRPVLGVEVLVVNENGEPMPPGEPGEIAIRSKYVRPRYWRRRDAPGDGGGALALRTGDRGRMDADGLVYHLGRLDGMVKIRGFRVEMIEIEALISALDGVAEVAVFGTGKDPSAVELAACVVVHDTSIDPVKVRSAVARELPAAMIPTRVSIVDALPRTPNGKLDRKRLEQLVDGPDAPPDPADAAGPVASPRALDRNYEPVEVERRIAEIWRNALSAEDVTTDDDFFALGGTSIKAVSVVARVRSDFGVPVPLAILFEAPTVAALAAAVIELRGESALSDGYADRPTVVRLARETDFAEICRLVNHYIETTTFNFRTEAQTPDEWIEDWSATRARYPWLVATVDDVVAGLAYASPWKSRPAYEWCAEVTVYVAQDVRCLGIGRALYRRLLELLDGQGFSTELAVIALPNAPSVALHEAFEFQCMGTLRGVGYKHGCWLDVGLWQRRGARAHRPTGADRPRPRPLGVTGGTR